MPYIPNTDDDRKAMLQVVGLERLEDLFASIPAHLRLKGPPDLPPAVSEVEAQRLAAGLRARNRGPQDLVSFLGAGYYDSFSPEVIDHLMLRGEFLTSYTPYQAETSQGTLQYLFEWQTLVCELTGLEISNAGLYEAGSALAEAVLMARDLTRRDRVVLPRSVHPEYRAVVKTYVRFLGMEVVETPVNGTVADADALIGAIDERTAAAVVPSPNFFGSLEDGAPVAARAKERGALAIAVVDPLSLALLRPPGEWGADIAVGEGQTIGSHPYYGGPTIGFLAARAEHLRRMPGRIIGQTVDLEGKRGFTMTFQTREQHIRREKATSNICTSQSLLALRSAIYLSLLGKTGLRRVAELCLQKAHYLASKLAAVPGCSVVNRGPWFREFTLQVPGDAAERVSRLVAKGFLAGVPLSRFDPAERAKLLIAVTEKRTKDEMDRFAAALAETR